MKTQAYILAFLLVITSTIKAQQNGEKFQLVWSDEFDYTGAPDSKYWTREVMASPPNDELEYYTASDKNSIVKNGMLYVRAIKETMGAKNYTSARLITANKITWTYGRIDVRAKLPSGVGTWPAIWMLYNSSKYGGWPASGEIDIMEHVGKDKNNVYASVHTQAYNHTINTQKTKGYSMTDAETAFHVYTCEWTPDTVRVFVDGNKYFEFVNEHLGWEKWPFDHPQMLILNVAIGGSWGGPTVDNTLFKNDSAVQMEVDYVRLYKQLKHFDFSYTPEVKEQASNVLFSASNYNNVKYQWIIPQGITPKTRTDSSSINVNWGCKSDSIGLQTSLNGDTIVTYAKVAIKNLKITGKSWIAANASGIKYTADSVAGAKFKWTTDAGISIVGSDSSRILKVDFANEGKIIVKITTVCNVYYDTISARFGDGQLPYPNENTPTKLPGKLNVGNFDVGGEGIAYHDTETANQGGASRTTEGVDTQKNDNTITLGWFNAGEWVEYTVDIANAGTYAASCRVSNGGTTSGSFDILIDNVVIADNVEVPITNAWTTFITKVTNTFELPAGKHILKILSNGGFNMGDLTFTLVSGVDKLKNQGAWNVFPNPASGKINITIADDFDNAVCQILNLDGKELLRSILNKQTTNTLQVNGLSKGVYLIRLSANGSQSTQKLIIE